MEMGKRIVMKLLIVLISFSFLDRGTSFFVFGFNLENLISPSHTNDIEIPHQMHLTNLIEDDEWVEIYKFNTSCFNPNSVKIIFTLNFASREFKNSIWQPPRLG
jgi:hypothetical protein